MRREGSVRPPSSAPRSAAGAFVGRDLELARLDSAFAAGAASIALSGPPGVGKTRLAIEAAHRFVASDATRAWTLVDLGEAQRGELLGALHAALGLEAPGGLDPLDGLVDRVASFAPTLVVLDGCDRLGDEVVALEAVVARRTPLTLLTTSRALQHADVVIDVAPLTSAHAIELFRVRARAQGATVDLDDGGAIDAIVRALDRLPFAIELAARRTRILSVAEIAARIEQSAPLFAQGPLDAAIATSYEPLTPDQRSALGQLAVFRGGFDLASAEQVLRIDGDVIEVLQCLRDRALIEVAPATRESTTRYALLSVVRAFVERQSELAAVRAAACERHADAYIARCSKAAEDHHWRAEPVARALLHAELENLRVIAERGVASGTPTWIVRAIDALRALLNVAWERRFSGYTATLERAIALGDAQGVSPQKLAQAHCAMAWSHLAAGNLPRCEASAARALALADGAGDDVGAAMALHARAFTQFMAPDRTIALATLEDACRRAERAGQRVLAARCTSMMGVLMFRHRDAKSALELLERALAEHRAHGDGTWEPITEQRIGFVALYSGDYARARSAIEHALEGLERSAYAHAERGFALANLALLEERDGRIDRAIEIADEAIVWLRGLSAWPFLGMILGRRGMLHHLRGDLGAAERDFEEGIRYCAVTVPLSAALNRAQLAALLADRGDGERARRELETARASIPRGDPADVVLPMVDAHVLVVEARTKGDREARRARAEELAQRPIPMGNMETYRAMLAKRLYERARDGRAVEPRPRAEPSLDPAALIVEAAGQRFRPPGGSYVDLPARSAQQRILSRLVDDHATGSRATIADLVTAGWSAAQARDRSARGRVYVVLSTLRTLGLRALLLRDRRGYYLDPAVRVEVR